MLDDRLNDEFVYYMSNLIDHWMLYIYWSLKQAQ